MTVDKHVLGYYMSIYSSGAGGFSGLAWQCCVTNFKGRLY